MCPCFRCNGYGWLGTGAGDGRTAGRVDCHVCGGSGEVTKERVLREIADIIAISMPPPGS